MSGKVGRQKEGLCIDAGKDKGIIFDSLDFSADTGVSRLLGVETILGKSTCMLQLIERLFSWHIDKLPDIS
ncbi:MAG: hypothetical protein U9P42_07715 [Candidatus Fermentibacteria bacterium]|nr:hypothetical protein [Candidatus Fermentibacteria bacterium]